MKKGIALLMAAILAALLCACSQGSQNELDAIILDKEAMNFSFETLSQDEDYQKPDYMDTDTEDFWLFYRKTPVNFNGQDGELSCAYNRSNNQTMKNLSVGFYKGEKDAQKLRDWFFSSVEELQSKYTLKEVYLLDSKEAGAEKIPLDSIGQAREYDVTQYNIRTEWASDGNYFTFATYKLGKESPRPIEFWITEVLE